MKQTNYAVYCFLVHYFTDAGNLINVDRIGYHLLESECTGNTVQELEKKAYLEAESKKQRFGADDFQVELEYDSWYSK